MTPQILIVTAVAEEAEAIGPLDGTTIVVAGVGRTNAACATTEALIENPDIALVISAGIAGSLPPRFLAIGSTIIATGCVYVEEGLEHPEGFSDMTGLGFPLGPFEGNRVPVASTPLRQAPEHFVRGPIATVATCSGTDAAAARVVARTGALAEAMEGAAVVHAALRRGIPGIEVRTISNRTGERDQQQWDLPAALDALGLSVRAFARIAPEAG